MREATGMRRLKVPPVSFQSTPPMREATRVTVVFDDQVAVSIHASHAGGDQPCQVNGSTGSLFQSTPPMREATIRAAGEIHHAVVSIHASHAGGDVT